MAKTKTKIKKFPPHRLYILMRNDLPSMNPGRAMAQAAHAANQFVYEHDGENVPAIREWLEPYGFGTTICLSANETQIRDIIQQAQSRNYHLSGLVYDPTYKFAVDNELAKCISKEVQTADPIISVEKVTFFRKELTCGYLFLAEHSSACIELVGSLPLHP